MEPKKRGAVQQDQYCKLGFYHIRDFRLIILVSSSVFLSQMAALTVYARKNRYVVDHLVNGRTNFEDIRV